MRFLVIFVLEVDLKSECPMGNMWRNWGRTFLPARKAQEISGRNSGQISGQISENISDISLQILRSFSETSFSRRAMLTS